MKNKEIMYSATAIVIALMFCITYYYVNNNDRYAFHGDKLFILDKKTGEVFNFYNGKKVKIEEVKPTKNPS